MSQKGALLLNRLNSGLTTTNKLTESDIAYGNSDLKNKEDDISSVSLGRSRNDTHTIADKSNMISQDAPSMPNSEEFTSDDEIDDDNLTTMRSDLYQNNDVKTDRSTLNKG